jgi:hypothetical protein
MTGLLLFEHLLPCVRGFQSTEDSFGRLIQPGHEFRFIDKVTAEGNIVDVDQRKVCPKPTYHPLSEARRPGCWDLRKIRLCF